jgi:hypothetical protein
MISIDQILQEASQLTTDQCLKLASQILAAADPAPTKGVEDAWDLVIRERILRYDQGQASSRPASDVFADLDRRLGA